MNDLYSQIGHDNILEISRLFYEGIKDDELLKPMYPKDLAPAEERFALFLVQVFGGPTTYSDQRGHPRLRMRHFPYEIDMKARAHWMLHITNAMKRIELEDSVRASMMTYFERASVHMMNK